MGSLRTCPGGGVRSARPAGDRPDAAAARLRHATALCWPALRRGAPSGAPDGPLRTRRRGPSAMSHDVWPALPLEEWKDTYDTLHMWTQIVGKVRLVQSPLINHWWQVPLYVTPRGLTTSI